MAAIFRQEVSSWSAKPAWGAVLQVVIKAVELGRSELARPLQTSRNRNRIKLRNHRSPKSVFPIPFIQRHQSTVSAPGLRITALMLDYCNLLISCYNFLYFGSSRVSLSEPSKAQQRVHALLVKRVGRYVNASVEPLSSEDMKSYLKSGDGEYSAFSAVLPLGVDAGVPESAGQVDLSGALQGFFPELAAQVREPRRLLLEPGARPRLLKRPFIKLHPTYQQLVARMVRVGLQKLRSGKHVWKHHGKPLVSGAFAVPKDGAETRLISALCPLNDLIDDANLFRPQFAYMPKLRAVRTCPGKRLVVFKRDARHYTITTCAWALSGTSFWRTLPLLKQVARCIRFSSRLRWDSGLLLVGLRR